MRNTMIKKLLLNGGKWETVEGVPPLILEKSLGKDLKDYKLYGNSIQNGTPTPDTPVEVESVGEYDEATGKYKIPVVAQGKNLFNIETYGENVDAQGGIYIDISQYEVGTKLTISTSDNYVFKIADLVGGAALIQAYNANNLIFTMSQRYKDCGRLYIISLKTYMSETKANLRNQNAQLEYGNTATDFEPYQEPIVTNIYLDEPLRKTENFTDYIDFANGKVVRETAEESVNLPKIPTLKGTTILDVNTTIKLSNMSATYKRR